MTWLKGTLWRKNPLFSQVCQEEHIEHTKKALETKTKISRYIWQYIHSKNSRSTVLNSEQYTKKLIKWFLYLIDFYK